MNDTFMVIFFAAAGFAFWLFVAIAVGKAAAKKSRRRWLWTLLSIFPLGPIVGPLFLASMPPVGEKPTPGQIVGRSVLIFIIVLSQLARLAEVGIQTSIQDKAESDFGWETESSATHYKQMSVDEIVMCLQLNSEVSAMIETATIEEGGDMYLFDSQREADIFNAAIELSDDLECEERTYEYTDLDKAMELVESGSLEPIRNEIIARLDSVEARVDRWNAGAGAMLDDVTRFDSARLNGDGNIVSSFTLIGFGADEISQADLDEFFKPSLISGSCSDPELADLRRNGYTLTYEYRAEDDGYIGAITLVGSC